MCMRVQSAITVTRVYDADTGVITIPAGLCPALTQRAIEAVVAELHLPTHGDTPLCWCGQPLTLSGLIPAQRTGEVITHGA
jgi:hypothetical protein